MLSVFCFSLALLKEDTTGTVWLADGRPASQAVVWFTGGTKSKPGTRAVIDQRDRTFIPHVSAVTVGTRVEFPNNDVVFHNVFTEFNSSKFDLGMYPKGTSKSQVFGRTGLAVIMCSIHPEMSAYVMVVDTPYYSVTDRKGRFKIASIPAGAYVVHAWHESGSKAEINAVVGQRQSVEIHLHR